MTQSELKDQTIDYIKNNLNDQTTKKDNGFYNVQAHSLEDEYSIYKDFYDKIYQKCIIL